jgi:phage terminase small subunit
MSKELNPRQKAFCDEYLKSANATRSYIAAGYKVSESVAAVNGDRMLRNAKVQEYIQKRQTKIENKRLATVQDVQEFWAKTMFDGEQVPFIRLKASELIAKSSGMFKETLEHTIKESSKVTFEIVRKNTNAK